MEQDSGRRSRGYLVAGLGALVAGLGTYVAVALIAPSGVTTTQYLTLDSEGELELEGIAVWFFACVSGIVAVLGSWFGLWWFKHPFAWLSLVLVGPALFGGVIPIEELFDEWLRRLPHMSYVAALAVWPFFAGLLTRWVVVRVLGERAIRRPGVSPRGMREWP